MTPAQGQGKVCSLQCQGGSTYHVLRFPLQGARTHATAASPPYLPLSGPHLDVQVVALLVLVSQLVNQLSGPEGHSEGGGIFVTYLIRYLLVKNEGNKP